MLVQYFQHIVPGRRHSFDQFSAGFYCAGSAEKTVSYEFPFADDHLTVIAVGGVLPSGAGVWRIQPKRRTLRVRRRTRARLIRKCTAFAKPIHAQRSSNPHNYSCEGV